MRGNVFLEFGKSVNNSKNKLKGYLMVKNDKFICN